MLISIDIKNIRHYLNNGYLYKYEINIYLVNKI